MPTFSVTWMISATIEIDALDEDAADMKVEGMTIAEALEASGYNITDHAIDVTDIYGPEARGEATMEAEPNDGLRCPICHAPYAEVWLKSMPTQQENAEGLATPDYLAILTELIKDVREHDDKLNNAEIPPTGDDYNEIWGMVELAARLAGLKREG